MEASGLIVGSAPGSSGTATIRSGAQITSSFTSIADQSGSNGSVSVTDPGSLLENSSDLTVGPAGNATLTIGNGAGVTAVAVWNRGIVNIEQGSLTSMGAFTQTGGATNLFRSADLTATTFAINGGALQGTGTVRGAVNIAAGALIAPGVNNAAGGTMTLTGGPLMVKGTLTEFLAPSGFGRTVVNEAVGLDSATSVLDIRQDPGYIPPVGTTLEIITANTPINGRFHRVFSRPFNDGNELWNVRYNYNGNNVLLVAMEGCGDERSDLILEYISYAVPLTPRCDDFSRSATPPSFTFLDLIRDSDYNWALIKQPLVIDNGFWGLEKLRSELLDVLPNNFPFITSGFRNPANNSGVAGRPQSRHLFGDAVDFRNYTRSFDECELMVQAANNSQADYVEDCEDTRSQGYHLHADWRFHPGVFQR
jgi:T5SS/PEP-CTERM-associated repeat protein